MTASRTTPDIVPALDPATHELVQLAVTIAVGNEQELRLGMARAAAARLSGVWVDELILQSYLFSGFPRALNAARAWRRASGRAAPRSDDGEDFHRVEEWAARGHETCATVYGETYERLRVNIRDLHPALDAWMIVEGYGKVLGRPGLDLSRRELCIVAVCAAMRQDRQLHAHLHGALNAGAAPEEIDEALAVGSADLDAESTHRFLHLWGRVVRRT